MHLIKDDEGIVESPQFMFMRVSLEFTVTTSTAPSTPTT
jgi:hypothetical protein